MNVEVMNPNGLGQYDFTGESTWAGEDVSSDLTPFYGAVDMIPPETIFMNEDVPIPSTNTIVMATGNGNPAGVNTPQVFSVTQFSNSKNRPTQHTFHSYTPNHFVGSVKAPEPQVALVTQTQPVPAALDQLRQKMIAHRDAYTTQQNELNRLRMKHKEVTGNDPLQKATTKVQKLQHTLVNIIDESGGIVAAENMLKLIAMMKAEKDDICRKLMLSILLRTSKASLKKRFVASGGLGILNVWIGEYKKESKPKMMRQILKVLCILPISVTTLEKAGIAKTVRSLHSHPDKSVSVPSAHIFKRWKSLVKQELSKSSKAKTATPAAQKKKKIVFPKKKSSVSAAPDKKVSKLVASNDFDAALSGSTATSTRKRKRVSSKADPKAKRLKRTVQLMPLESTGETVINKLESRKKATHNTHKSRPLSADEIKKQKFIEKVSKRTTPITEAPKMRGRVSRTFASSKPEHSKKDEAIRSKLGNSKEKTAEAEMKVTTPAKSLLQKKKKRVSWSTKLKTVHTYTKYLSSMNRMLNFQEAMSRERSKEREFCQSQRRAWMDKLFAVKEVVPWRTPALIEFETPPLKPKILQSPERIFQMERETKTKPSSFTATPPNPIEAVREDPYDEKRVVDVPWKVHTAAQPTPAPVIQQYPNTLAMGNHSGGGRYLPNNNNNFSNEPPAIILGGGTNAGANNATLQQILAAVSTGGGSSAGFGGTPNIPLNVLNMPHRVINPQNPMHNAMQNPMHNAVQNPMQNPMHNPMHNAMPMHNMMQNSMRPKNMCRYFSTPQGCRFGNSCKFLHPQQQPFPQNNYFNGQS
eukprot:TRINITY_DN494_c0_g1_i1.p1 TRINITY_DN494_c0_g1~~TRINITY_DN494_c0_g1_i1.p1  ORF type:complete len:809 (+),score=140.38 TRINITY_DN494_c0_g1_i1:203-2629(+)